MNLCVSGQVSVTTFCLCVLFIPSCLCVSCAPPDCSSDLFAPPLPPVRVFCSSPLLVGFVPPPQLTLTPRHWDYMTLGHWYSGTLEHCVVKPEMLWGVQTEHGIPHDKFNMHGIAHARTNRKYDIFIQRLLVQSLTYILELGQGTCTLTKHTWRWTYSALRYFLFKCCSLQTVS